MIYSKRVHNPIIVSIIILQTNVNNSDKTINSQLLAIGNRQEQEPPAARRELYQMYQRGWWYTPWLRWRLKGTAATTKRG